MPLSVQERSTLLRDQFVSTGLATKAEHFLYGGENNYKVCFSNKEKAQRVLNDIDFLGVRGAQGKKRLASVSEEGVILSDESLKWFGQTPNIGVDGFFEDKTGNKCKAKVAGYQIIFTDENVDTLDSAVKTRSFCDGALVSAKVAAQIAQDFNVEAAQSSAQPKKELKGFVEAGGMIQQNIDFLKQEMGVYNPQVSYLADEDNYALYFTGDRCIVNAKDALEYIDGIGIKSNLNQKKHIVPFSSKKGDVLESAANDGYFKILPKVGDKGWSKVGEQFQESLVTGYRIIITPANLEKLRSIAAEIERSYQEFEVLPKSVSAKQPEKTVVANQPQENSILKKMFDQAKSKGLNHAFVDSLTTLSPQLVKVFNERTAEESEKILKSARTVVSEEVLTLMKRQIICVFKEGEGIEQNCYRDQIFNGAVPPEVERIKQSTDPNAMQKALNAITQRHLDNFIKRLQDKRPIVFVGSKDSTMLRDGKKGNFYDDEGQLVKGCLTFDFTNLHNLGSGSGHFCFNEYINYDEMALSALIGVSSESEFINKGDRDNKGKLGEEGSYVKKGVVLGAVGARFEREGRMESRRMRQNTDQESEGLVVPQILGRSAAYNREQHDMWQKFYESVPSQLKEGQASYIKIPENKGGGFLDALKYKKDMKVRFHSYLSEANLRAQEAGQKAYIHLPGLGLGVWQVCNEQNNLYVEALEEVLLENAYPQITDIDLSWVINQRIQLGQGKHINGVNLFASKNDPSQNNKDCGYTELDINGKKTDKIIKITANGKLLVAMFAWDSGAFAGNEYGIGSLNASGDPAHVSSAPDTFYAFTSYLNLFPQRKPTIVSKYPVQEAVKGAAQSKAGVKVGVKLVPASGPAPAPASVPAPAGRIYSDNESLKANKARYDEEDDSEEEETAVATKEELPTLDEINQILDNYENIAPDARRRLHLIKYVLEGVTAEFKTRIKVDKQSGFTDFDFKITQDDRGLFSRVLFSYAAQNPTKQVRFVSKSTRGIFFIPPQDIVGKRLSEITNNQEIKALISAEMAKPDLASLQQPVSQVRIEKPLEPRFATTSVSNSSTSKPAALNQGYTANFAAFDQRSAANQAPAAPKEMPEQQQVSKKTPQEVKEEIQKNIKIFFDKSCEKGMYRPFNITLKGGGAIKQRTLKINIVEAENGQGKVLKIEKTNDLGLQAESFIAECRVDNFMFAIQSEAFLNKGENEDFSLEDLEKLNERIKKSIKDLAQANPISKYNPSDDVGANGVGADQINEPVVRQEVIDPEQQKQNLYEKARQISRMTQADRLGLLQKINAAQDEVVEHAFGPNFFYQGLVDAVKEGEVEIVKAVLGKIRQKREKSMAYESCASQIDRAVFSEGYSLMHLAVLAKKNNEEMVDFLSGFGFGIDGYSIDSDVSSGRATPLHSIAQDANKIATAKKLLLLGANPNATIEERDAKGILFKKSVLFAAIESNNYELAKFLISKGVRIDYASYSKAEDRFNVSSNVAKKEDKDLYHFIRTTANVELANVKFCNLYSEQSNKGVSYQKPELSFNYDSSNKVPNYYLTFKTLDEAKAFLSKITKVGVKNNEDQLKKIFPVDGFGDIAYTTQSKHFTNLPRIGAPALNDLKKTTKVAGYQFILTNANVSLLKDREELIEYTRISLQEFIRNGRKGKSFGLITLGEQKTFYDDSGNELSSRSAQIKMNEQGKFLVNFTNSLTKETEEKEFDGYQWLNELSNDELKALQDRIKKSLSQQQEVVKSETLRKTHAAATASTSGDVLPFADLSLAKADSRPKYQAHTTPISNTGVEKRVASVDASVGGSTTVEKRRQEILERRQKRGVDKEESVDTAKAAQVTTATSGDVVKSDQWAFVRADKAIPKINETMPDRVRTPALQDRAATTSVRAAPPPPLQVRAATTSGRAAPPPPPVPARQDLAVGQTHSRGVVASASSSRNEGETAAQALLPRRYNVPSNAQRAADAAQDRPRRGGILSRVWQGFKGIFSKKSRAVGISDGADHDLEGHATGNPQRGRVEERVAGNPQPSVATAPRSNALFASPYTGGASASTPQRAQTATQGTPEQNPYLVSASAAKRLGINQKDKKGGRGGDGRGNRGNRGDDDSDA